MNNLYENLITDNIQESDFLLFNINNKILIKDSNNKKIKKVVNCSDLCHFFFIWGSDFCHFLR